MTIRIELEFIPVSERLPEESGGYVCLTDYDRVETHTFSTRHGAFNTLSSQSIGEAESTKINSVTHWAAMPDLGKAKEKAPADYLWALNHWRTPLSEKQEEGLQEIVNGRANESMNTEQRRRDLFERVACQTVSYHENLGRDWDNIATRTITESILSEADKFARGE